MTGKKMAPGDLIKLNYARNNQGVSLFCLFTGERECSCHLELTRRPFTQQYHDPITFKVFNDHTAIAAIKTTGNVYARESIDRLNLKPNNLHDVRFVLFSPVEPSLVMGGAVAARLGSTEPTNSLARPGMQLLTDEPFTRKDVITLQDPLNLDKKDGAHLSSSSLPQVFPP